MKNTILFQALFVFACLSVFNPEIRAQNTAPRSKADIQAAPSVNPSLNKVQTNSAYEAKYAQKAAIESKKMTTRLSSLSTPPRDEATLRALKAEMDANYPNPGYDMARSFQLFSGSSLVIYPFKSFDPDFPLVIRTGDKNKDALNYNAAKAEWATRKKAARMNPAQSQK
ncbi:MAG: hypothetical protein SF052_15530 [Bacteroidia bacterium]|nr:hypothetical protein [Bacteroidia bacterium]